MAEKEKKTDGMHLLTAPAEGPLCCVFFPPPQSYRSHSNSAATATYESVLLTVAARGEGEETHTHLCNFYSELHNNEKSEAFFCRELTAATYPSPQSLRSSGGSFLTVQGLD